MLLYLKKNYILLIILFLFNSNAFCNINNIDSLLDVNNQLNHIGVVKIYNELMDSERRLSYIDVNVHPCAISKLDESFQLRQPDDRKVINIIKLDERYFLLEILVFPVSYQNVFVYMLYDKQQKYLKFVTFPVSNNSMVCKIEKCPETIVMTGFSKWFPEESLLSFGAKGRGLGDYGTLTYYEFQDGAFCFYEHFNFPLVKGKNFDITFYTMLPEEVRKLIRKYKLKNVVTLSVCEVKLERQQ